MKVTKRGKNFRMFWSFPYKLENVLGSWILPQKITCFSEESETVVCICQIHGLSGMFPQLRDQFTTLALWPVTRFAFCLRGWCYMASFGTVSSQLAGLMSQFFMSSFHTSFKLWAMFPLILYVSEQTPKLPEQPLGPLWATSDMCFRLHFFFCTHHRFSCAQRPCQQYSVAHMHNLEGTDPGSKTFHLLVTSGQLSVEYVLCDVSFIRSVSYQAPLNEKAERAPYLCTVECVAAVLLNDVKCTCETARVESVQCTVTLFILVEYNLVYQPGIHVKHELNLLVFMIE